MTTPSKGSKKKKSNKMTLHATNSHTKTFTNFQITPDKGYTTTVREINGQSIEFQNRKCTKEDENGHDYTYQNGVLYCRSCGKTN
eukprot:CAMPEP_0201567054 /NCGR_PEP_ID=MMETSP0190_2-20130828/7330_1 /ASSEMBLY_ACC=CAM_ASM_000263 /TAXON_ID=37353 /ORGANISM="Rosalina sp." /LENGTH=84 /DNA_ID=CAMNT_0047986581 /DNA_START=86 /DNA_END=340 /DNA_ORIENTATION=+